MRACDDRGSTFDQHSYSSVSWNSNRSGLVRKRLENVERRDFDGPIGCRRRVPFQHDDTTQRFDDQVAPAFVKLTHAVDDASAAIAMRDSASGESAGASSAKDTFAYRTIMVP